MTGLEAATFLAPLLAFFIAAASPGPATLAVAATSMAQGRAAGLLLGIGLSVGLIFWGTLTAAGLGALIVAWAPALLVLKIAGGLYLLYLAWISARSALRTEPLDDMTQRTVKARNLVWRGIALNLMNPKAVLAWAAVIAVGLPSTEASGYLVTVVALCAVLSVVIYGTYAVLFSVGPVRMAYARGRRICEALFALGFAAAGLRLMFWRAGPA
ncbi:MAG: LysE family translocator [Pseudomonadota bacterium]